LSAGRHRAFTTAQATVPRAALGCISCGRPVTTTLVVQSGRVYCSWNCAGSLEPIVPGRYLG